MIGEFLSPYDRFWEGGDVVLISTHRELDTKEMLNTSVNLYVEIRPGIV
jgi:hypothetical protein